MKTHAELNRNAQPDQTLKIDPFLNRVTQADCLHALRQLPDESVDLVVTDPPYIVHYKDRFGRSYPNDDNSRWVFPAFAEIYRVLKPDRYAVCFYGWKTLERFLWAWKECGFTPVGHFTFVKGYASRVGHTRMMHEQAYLLAKGNPRKPVAPLDDVIEFHYTGNKLHPTQKPVSAITPLIKTYSRENDIVLDPFGGSGTTGVAAHQCHRRFILFEMTREYSDAARQRLARIDHSLAA